MSKKALLPSEWRVGGFCILVKFCSNSQGCSQAFYPVVPGCLPVGGHNGNNQVQQLFLLFGKRFVSALAHDNQNDSFKELFELRVIHLLLILALGAVSFAGTVAGINEFLSQRFCCLILRQVEAAVFEPLKYGYRSETYLSEIFRRSPGAYVASNGSIGPGFEIVEGVNFHNKKVFALEQTGEWVNKTGHVLNRTVVKYTVFKC
jgi:hypothetical protein